MIHHSRMVQTAPLAFLSLLCLSAFADRGRVRVTSSSIVADNGMLIRGNTSHMNNNAKSESYWKGMRDNYGYNAMRILAYIGPWWQYGAGTRAPLPASEMEKVYAVLDPAVEVASRLGMYLVIDDHSGKIGDFNKEDSKTFWGGVAPRYKDRTHVIYEIKNEPVGGEGTMERKYEGKDPEIRYQEEMYAFIRERAPGTHIICWSFCEARRGMLPVVQRAPAIDYGNASVGFHPYVVDPDWGGLTELIKAGYPVINTELGYISTDEWAGIKNLPGYFAYEQDKIQHSIRMAETLGISWLQLYHLDPAKALYAKGLWPADDGKTTAEPVHRANLATSRVHTRGPKPAICTGTRETMFPWIVGSSAGPFRPDGRMVEDPRRR